MRLRVVWGLLVTMATFSPTRALVRVDLPTLGRPHRVMMPDFLIVDIMFLAFYWVRAISRKLFDDFFPDQKE